MDLNTYQDDAAAFNTWYAVVMPKIKFADAHGDKRLVVPYLPSDAEAILKSKGFGISRVGTDITITW